MQRIGQQLREAYHQLDEGTFLMTPSKKAYSALQLASALTGDVPIYELKL